MISDGAADEVVALAAVLGEPSWPGPYLERARAARAESVAAGEGRSQRVSAVRALAALAAGRNQEAYDLAMSRRHRSAPSTTRLSSPASPRCACSAGTMRRERLQDDAVTVAASSASRRSSRPRATSCWGARTPAPARAAEARQAYEEAFRIWKDADADLPLLVEARKEYAAL